MTVALGAIITATVSTSLDTNRHQAHVELLLNFGTTEFGLRTAHTIGSVQVITYQQFTTYKSTMPIRIRNNSAFAKQLLTLLTVLVAGSLFSKVYSQDEYDVDPTTGLRMERYRAPVPADIPDGITLDNETAVRLQAGGDMVFIDVYPPKGLGPDPLEGHWVTNEKRQSIPGAVWLPEVGRGTLSPEATDYFKRNLARLTNNEPSTPLAFFCTSDCWQSWNASRRAIGWGYTAVHWYPLGSDGWQEAGNELQSVQPVNFLDDSTPSDAAFPDIAQVILIDQQGAELPIGVVEFTTGSDQATGVNVDITSSEFEDQFLSMRPFKCLTDTSEWFCYLPYPYELTRTITPEDMTELEYQLLFIWKSPKTFGIDAWNGVYYQLTMQEDGTITGQLLQGDLNVLAEPPEPGSHPIELSEFIDEGADNRLYPSLVIRP